MNNFHAPMIANNSMYEHIRVGEYIHVGRTTDLRSEHILPLSLGGNVQLLEASCHDCEKITAKFEGIVARTMLGNFRVKMDAPSRRRKTRPSKLPLTVYKNGVRSTIFLTPEDYPGTFCLPGFPEPSLVSGLAANNSSPGIWGSRTSEISSLTPIGYDGFSIGTIKINAFVRTLAKIAHGHVCGLYGLRNFKPLLLPLILGETNEYDKYVGCTIKGWPCNSLFALQSYRRDVNGRKHIGCEIEFLAKYQGPTYNIIVGSL